MQVLCRIEVMEFGHYHAAGIISHKYVLDAVTDREAAITGCATEISLVGRMYTSVIIRDSNPGPVFSIPGFGIVEFLIPGSRRDYVIPAV